MRANKNLYNNSAEVRYDLQRFTDVPYLKIYMPRTIRYCIEKLDITLFNHKIKVLDIGTGTGHLLTYLLNYVPAEAIWAVDVSEKNIEMGKRHFPNVNFYIGDFIHDFKPDIKFDLISAFSAVHHFYNWQSVFNKIDTLLNKRGVIYIDHEPTAGLALKTCSFIAKVKNFNRPGRLLAEYHQFFEYITPFNIYNYLKERNYKVELFLSNIALIGEAYKKLGLNIAPFVGGEILIDKKFKRILRHLFLSYKIIAKKL